MGEGGGGSSFEVAPSITALVGDVTRPRSGFVPPERNLAHLPGDGGLLAGTRMVLGLVTHGETWMSSLARR